MELELKILWAGIICYPHPNLPPTKGKELLSGRHFYGRFIR